jgi:hypothetical protein
MRLWAPFIFTSILSWVIYLFAWSQASYWLFLSALAACSLALAARVLFSTGVRWKPLVAVVFGFVIGQWWLLELVGTRLLWAIRGFAP